MLSHIKETDVSVPFRDRGWFYYVRTMEGRQYPIHCRRLATGTKFDESQPEEIVLDVNQLAEGQPFMAVGGMTVSPDGFKLAYSTDNTGFRQYVLAVKDLRTGQLLPDHAEKTGSVVWANDNKTLFYTVEDSAKRQYRLYRHAAGTAGPDDLVFEERDERFDLSVFKSRSKAYLFLISGSHTTTEVRYLLADQPHAEWKVLAPRRQEIEYYPDHHGEFFYLRVNDTGRNFRLVKAPVSDPQSSNWREVISHRASVMLEDIDFFKDFSVAQERENGLPQITITDLASGKSRRLKFPEPAYTAGADVNKEFDTIKFRYNYQSFITPTSVFEYDVTSGATLLLKEKEVPGGYDRTRYRVERLSAPAPDGVQIPISVVYLKDTKLDGQAPLYLYGYGAYGLSMDIGFDSNLFSLVDRGVVCAVAHIRGGGDLGKLWHDGGRMLHKKNTFTDFIASGEYLLTHGHGAKDRLVIEGGSAGGLLVGAVVNMRPDLFRAAVTKVPFVDVINTMLDESLPLTVGEFEEWGNPKVRSDFDYMYSYSPYDNLTARAYPNLLVKTSFNDSQVMYWEPAKYVAKMRALRTDQNTLLLKTNMGAGHGGASGRYDHLKETALDFAFVLTQVGIKN